MAELFAHVADARDFYAVLVASGKIHDVRELGEAHFGRSIAERLAGPRRGAAVLAETRGALAQALAGALFSLLSSWVRQGMAVPPAQMDRLFHRLVPGGSAAPSAASVPPYRLAGRWPHAPADAGPA